MTPDIMLDTWRQLIADGHAITQECDQAGSLNDTDNQYCRIDAAYTGACYEGRDRDPLKAFEAAYAAFQNAQEGKL